MNHELKMIKFTKTTLEKIESIFKLLGYKVRYEKGNFSSGYCILEDQKVVVVNKFFDLTGRIEVLRDLLSGIPVDEHLKGHPLESFYLKMYEYKELASDEPK